MIIEKHHLQKIYQHLNNLERQINQVRAFGKRILKNIETSDKDMNDSIAQKKQIAQKSKNVVFKKELNNLDYLNIQKQQYEGYGLWMKNLNLQNWIQISKQPLKMMKEQADKFQKKIINKQAIKESQIAAFRLQLTNRTVQHKNNIKEIVKTISQWNAKNCCELLQNLTGSMQKMKMLQKKEKAAGEGSKVSKNK